MRLTRKGLTKYLEIMQVISIGQMNMELSEDYQEMNSVLESLTLSTENTCSVKLSIPSVNDDIHELLTQRESWSFYKREIKLILGERGDTKRWWANYKREKQFAKDKSTETRFSKLHKERFVSLILGNPIPITEQIK